MDMIHLLNPTDLTDAADAYVLTPGRFWSLVAAVVGMVSLVAGVAALSRRSGRRGLRHGAGIAALAAGAVCTALGVLVVLSADGGPGSGNGIVGGYLTIVAGLLGAVLGTTALIRSTPVRRLGPDHHVAR